VFLPIAGAGQADPCGPSVLPMVENDDATMADGGGKHLVGAPAAGGAEGCANRPGVGDDQMAAGR
jgi:hypothetical protein